MRRFRKRFKGCLPPPPPGPVKVKMVPAENSCHQGYKVGWRQGKGWAQIVSRDRGTFMDGKTKLKCLMDWMKRKVGSVYHICSIRGAKEGYKKWWVLLRHKN